MTPANMPDAVTLVVIPRSHDVGGFDGPRPDAELFVRWVGFGIFMPRFSIHSWNTDGTANELWMHPEVTAHVRDLIKFRYRLLPYLYDLTWRYGQHYEPIIRPTFYDFPDDPKTFDENDEMLLVAGDAASFERFYVRHVDEMLGFFVRRTRDAELAADLTAETFAAALKARQLASATVV